MATVILTVVVYLWNSKFS